MVLEVDTSLQDLLHLHGRPLVAAPRGADSAGLNQYRKVQRQQREASFLSNVDLGEHDAERSGNLRDPNPSLDPYPRPKPEPHPRPKPEPNPRPKPEPNSNPAQATCVRAPPCRRISTTRASS